MKQKLKTSNDNLDKLKANLASLSMCSNKYVDIYNDQKNCGMCGNICPETHYCKQGVCSSINNSNNLQQCEGTGNYYTNVYSDVSNCGTCGNVCSSGTCVNGICNYDYNSDNTNCGPSRVRCLENQQCVVGNCYPPTSIITIINKGDFARWINSLSPKAKYSDRIFTPNNNWYTSEIDGDPSQTALSISNIESIPVISGFNKNILSLELVPYNGNDIFSFINYNNGNDPFLSIDTSVINKYDRNFNNGAPCEKITHIHFKYIDKIYEIKVTPNNCGGMASNISFWVI